MRKSGDTVWIALRPEKLRIARDAPPANANENCVAGRVWDIGYLGDLSIYKVRLDNGFVMKAAAANVTRLVERPIGWDETRVAHLGARRWRGADTMSDLTLRRARSLDPQRSKRLVILLPYLWLAIFFLVPFLIVLKISLSQTAIAQPPYMPVFDLAARSRRAEGFFRRAVVRQLCAARVRPDLPLLLSQEPRDRRHLDRRFCC